MSQEIYRRKEKKYVLHKYKPSNLKSDHNAWLVLQFILFHFLSYFEKPIFISFVSKTSLQKYINYLD